MLLKIGMLSLLIHDVYENKGGYLRIWSEKGKGVRETGDGTYQCFTS
jgi:hypothetical protein